MAIYRLLQNSAFAPEDIAPLAAAYEDCLRALKLSDRSDPMAEILAKKIIEIASAIRPSSVVWRLRKLDNPAANEACNGACNKWRRAGILPLLVPVAQAFSASPGQPHEVRLSATGPCVRLCHQ